MANYLIWLNCKESDFKSFYEIVNARTGDDAKRIILNDKRFSRVTVESVKLYRA